MHIVGDAVKEAYSGKYDMMIAHPPCTYMSRAGARWMYPTAGNLCQDRFAKAMEAKAMFLELLNAPIEFIAVENPTPLKVVELPKHSQAISTKFWLAIVWGVRLYMIQHLLTIDELQTITDELAFTLTVYGFWQIIITVASSTDYDLNNKIEWWHFPPNR